METILRFLLPAYLFVYLIFAFFWRSLLVWKRTGVNPFVFGKVDNAHDYVGMQFRLTMAALVIVIMLHTISSKAYAYLVPILWLDHPALHHAGLSLLVVSLIWTVIAQAQMGTSWRIGIDVKTKTQLVTHGVFGISRNPIFLGMRVTLLGFFLVLPNAVTLTTLVHGETLMQIQVRLEEEHLRQAHGEAYRNYGHKTRRWL